MYAYKLLLLLVMKFSSEYHCPVRFSFIALIPITTMLIGDITYRWTPWLAEVMIWLGTIGQLLSRPYALVSYGKVVYLNKKSTSPAFLFTCCCSQLHECKLSCLTWLSRFRVFIFWCRSNSMDHFWTRIASTPTNFITWTTISSYDGNHSCSSVCRGCGIFISK